MVTTSLCICFFLQVCNFTTIKFELVNFSNSKLCTYFLFNKIECKHFLFKVYNNLIWVWLQQAFVLAFCCRFATL
jgi:hypothetical protein